MKTSHRYKWFQTTMSLFHLFSGEEHWLGLRNIYKLTNRQNVRTQLKIILESFSGEIATVTYDDFSLKDQVKPQYVPQ